MTVIDWLIVLAVTVLALWLVVAVVDERAARRPAPPVRPVRSAPPALPAPPRASVDMARAHTVRAPACGRHRRPEGPPQ